MLTLGFSFFIIALTYATVGFGGGSSYLAILSISNIPYSLLPQIALICNLIVVTGGTWIFYKNKLIDWRLSTPFILSSVPMAFLGGLYKIQEKTFILLLASSLLIASIRLLWSPKSALDSNQRPTTLKSYLIGGGLGLLSGIVGIGGGIFLAPIMLLMGWGKPKQIAATASLFILLNSISGLIGQVIKNPQVHLWSDYLPLFLAVFIGGQIGSRIGSHHKVPHLWIERATGILILYVSVQLIVKHF